MSTPTLFDADIAATELGKKRRALMPVDAQIVDSYRAARSDGDREQMRLLRRNAAALDPQLLAELDGFDYPAAA
ncbi:hypothetical protein [Streptomyces coeruleorubidus]|uniref:Uncharacterized protein n=1 Tax=Streptomyces coeruleorubidus TaxID=116188 RepID=A0A5J6I587_STRC4|nr:hypothetical protein [Streptomyces coeruleorubidus]QEV23975.1 hypothetical protein CP976_07325 [Streptomyces coeruleorubidus]GGT85684.1 hypothetical protein GCM10010256_52250 [Streptomyces coeruleorubidus]